MHSSTDASAVARAAAVNLMAKLDNCHDVWQESGPSIFRSEFVNDGFVFRGCRNMLREAVESEVGERSTRVDIEVNASYRAINRIGFQFF